MDSVGISNAHRFIVAAAYEMNYKTHVSLPFAKV